MFDPGAACLITTQSTQACNDRSQVIARDPTSERQQGHSHAAGEIAFVKIRSDKFD
jgi:hypothetical protein